MTFRPVADVWILARPKLRNGHKYYGSYPAGFLSRARALLGVGPLDPVLHVCGGRVRDYPYAGFGPNDRTLDLDPKLKPDFLQDARQPFPRCPGPRGPGRVRGEWAAVLIDRPYTLIDAAQYAPGADALPDLNALVKAGIAVVPVGARVASLDYLWPQPPRNAKEVAVVGVGTGRNGRARWFVVCERKPERER